MPSVPVAASGMIGWLLFAAVDMLVVLLKLGVTWV